MLLRFISSASVLNKVSDFLYSFLIQGGSLIQGGHQPATCTRRRKKRYLKSPG